jgi:hypothetical protein
MRAALAVVVSVAAAAIALRATCVGAQDAPCDRACLESLADRYVAAVAAHDPSRLPLAAGVKFTENGQRLPAGDGLWNTATAAGGYALHIADVERGQSVLMGTIREADVPTIFVLRLGVVQRKIAEIETLVIRNREAAESLDKIGAPRQAWLESVPETRRHSRADLVRIANMYFSGIEHNDGKGDYPLAPDCARLENGAWTAGPKSPAREAGRAGLAGAQSAPRMGCLEQFRTGMFHYVTRIRDRRFVAVDTERGLAFAFAFFDNAAGDARHVTLSDGREVESGPVVPWTWQIAEVFKIVDGKIGPVESVLHPVPYGMGSGWSTWEQALSSEPREK